MIFNVVSNSKNIFLQKNSMLGSLTLPKDAAQSIHKKRLGLFNIGIIRGKGRKPVGKCVTLNFTEGDVKLRRSIFRKLKSIIIDQYSDLMKLASAS